MKSTASKRDALIHDLIAYLRSFDDEDRDLGHSAAQNLEESLEKSLAHRDSLTQAGSGPNFWVGEVGGKGMLDWSWSEPHRRQLERFSEKIIRLSQPRWWEFWK